MSDEPGRSLEALKRDLHIRREKKLELAGAIKKALPKGATQIGDYLDHVEISVNGKPVVSIDRNLSTVTLKVAGKKYEGAITSLIGKYPGLGIEYKHEYA